ncbi:TetR/AcrR family transcriptional regulator [Prauserella rugosa]|uniref:TetR family transcriptional regulator n=1 Tax=Prauserella rugosa TaxID=43354 RepID=A0A660CJT5_9PSEU|nr:TetR/AcrR family transcriptional regulator [Prauserella rugosa]KMS82346.1 hypothetical protein ACZ91_59040 [Streptomyces regensis]TWH21421.1 TetR family transcriptional regulator [Prauserella rugosa]
MVAESSEARRPRRGYESPVRRERAQRTREHVIATAATLFAEHGYAATSMRRIATEAGVGLETVTQTGRKADLLLAAFRSQLADSPDAIDLTELIGMPTPGDLETTLQAAVAALAERLRDSLGIWRAFTVAAATDDTIAAVRSELAAARRRDIASWLATYEDAGMLAPRDETARGRLADALGLLVSHDAYDQLVGVCGWPHTDFVTWTAAAIANQLRGTHP